MRTRTKIAVAGSFAYLLVWTDGLAVETYPFAQHQVQATLLGAPRLPDFEGRDRKFARYRTRILASARHGADFARRYSVVTIGCGTDCSFGYIVDLADGKVFDLPRGGEEFMDLRFNYRLDSALMVVRWRSIETKRCYDETFLWKEERFQQIDKKDVGDTDYCLKDWP